MNICKDIGITQMGDGNEEDCVNISPHHMLASNDIRGREEATLPPPLLPSHHHSDIVWGGGGGGGVDLR